MRYHTSIAHYHAIAIELSVSILECCRPLVILSATLIEIRSCISIWNIMYVCGSLVFYACCTCRFPIVEPDPGHTKLRLSREGLEAIERITTPIAAVAVSLRCNFLSTHICFSLKNWQLLCSPKLKVLLKCLLFALIG